MSNTSHSASAARYANALFQLAKEAKVLDSISSDLDKIIKSGKALTKEIDKVISFDPTEFVKKTDQSVNAIKSVLASIQPLDKDEETKITTGSILVVDDNKNNTTLLKKRLQKILTTA